MSNETKKKMTGKQKASVIFSLMIVIGAIWWTYNIYQRDVVGTQQVNDALKQACEGDKTIVENAKALQGSEAQSIVDKYNEQCGDITGIE